jgi:hypothetical protein
VIVSIPGVWKTLGRHSDCEVRCTPSCTHAQHNNTQLRVQVLSKNGILSAPVLVSPDLEDLAELHEEEPKPELLGWVDVNDIVRELVDSAFLLAGSSGIAHCRVFGN